jgi:hypothetical protein
MLLAALVEGYVTWHLNHNSIKVTQKISLCFFSVNSRPLFLMCPVYLFF